MMTLEERKPYDAKYRKTHAEEIRQRQAEWREAHVEELRQYYAEYRKKHAEKIRQSGAKWDKAHAEERKPYRAEWRKTPEGRASAVAGQAKRRARVRGAGGVCTAKDLRAIRASQINGSGELICWLCKQPIEDTPHLEHFIPLAKGGTNDPSNLHYTHASCNLHKGTKVLTSQ